MTIPSSDQLKQQIKKRLQSIQDKALRHSLEKKIMRAYQETKEDALFGWIDKYIVPSCQFKPSDYPNEYALYCQCIAQVDPNFQSEDILMDEFGWQASFIDRMQWQIFLRGIQMVQDGALSRYPNEYALYCQCIAQVDPNFESEKDSLMDTFSWQSSLIDRMQWQIFLRGIQMVLDGALSQNQKTKD